MVADPVERTLDLAAVRGVSALACGVIGAVDCGDLAVFVGIEADAFYKVCAPEPDLVSGEEAEILLRRLNHEVLLFNKDFLCENGFPCSHFGSVLVDGKLNFLLNALGIVVNNDLERTENRHGSRCIFVEVVPDAGFKQTEVNNGVCL